MKTHTTGIDELMFLSGSIDAKFPRRQVHQFGLGETTLLYIFFGILYCLPWLLIDFDFQHYNINLNF